MTDVEIVNLKAGALLSPCKDFQYVITGQFVWISAKGIPIVTGETLLDSPVLFLGWQNVDSLSPGTGYDVIAAILVSGKKMLMAGKYSFQFSEILSDAES